MIRLIIEEQGRRLILAMPGVPRAIAINASRLSAETRWVSSRIQIRDSAFSTLTVYGNLLVWPCAWAYLEACPYTRSPQEDSRLEDFRQGLGCSGTHLFVGSG